MIEKILVAIDNSSRNQLIFNMAVSLARVTQASLMLLHILSEEDPDYPILPTYAYYSVLKGNNNGMFHQIDEYEEQQMEFLRYLTKKAIAAGVDAEYAQLSGIPGWEICEIASNWSADMIIIGSRGLKGVKEMFVGSVSNYVTHHAPCSVLIVRSNTDLISDSLDPFFESEIEVNGKRQVLNQK